MRRRASVSSRHSPERAYAANGSRPTASPLDAPVAINVCVRSRPLTDTELDAGDEDVWQYEPEHGRIYERDIRSVHARDHTFGHLFPPTSRTEDIYHRLGLPIVQAALQGINGTIFAYGQTGSGKTYTVNGTSEEPGLLPMAIADVFRFVQLDSGKSEYLIRASYMEIYNEELYDLFDPDGSSNLRIVDGALTGPYVRGLTEEVVTSPGRVMELLAIGEANRHVAATKMNAHSSRSHTVFRLIIESRPVMPGSGGHGGMSGLALTVAGGGAAGPAPLLTKAGDLHRPPPSLLTDGNGIVRLASLHVVDLAGSERVGKSQVVGEALKEASGINVSLLTLGVVIHKLTTGEPHVPYRDSKLTRLLSASLGGNAKTSVVVCISPARYNVSESRSSLTFAARAMKVLNRVRVNEVADEQSLLERYKAEIEKLQRLLADERQSRAMLLNQSNRGGGEIFQSQYDGMRSSLEDKLHALQEQLQRALSECRDTTTTCADLLQLLFVFSHGAGHVRSLPSLLQILSDVATERVLPGAATRSILSTIPKFALRVARMARAGEAPVIAGSALETEAVNLAGGVEVVEGSTGSAIRRGQGMLSVSALRSPQLQRTPSRDIVSRHLTSPGQMGESGGPGGLTNDIEDAVFDGTVEYFTPGSAARQIRALLSLRETFSSQLREAQEALALKQAELDLMRRRSEASESREAELHSKAMAAEEQAAVGAAQLRTAREDNSKLQQEIDRMKAEAVLHMREHATVAQNSERKLAEYDERLRAVRADLARESSDRSELQTELEGVRLRLIDSEQTIHGLVKEVEAARSALMSAKDEMVSLTADRDGREKEVAVLEIKLQAAEGRGDAAQREVENLQHQAAEASSRQSSLQTRCDQLQASRSALQASFDTTQAALSQLQRDKQVLTDRVADSQREVSTLRAQLAAREAELQSTGEGRESVEKDLLLSRHGMAAMDTRLKETEGRLHATQSEVSVLRTQLADSHAQLLATRTKLDGKRAQVADLSALLEERRVEVAQLQGAVAQKEHKVQELEAAIIALRSEKAAELEQAGGQSRVLASQLREAKQTLAELQRRAQELDEQAEAADMRAEKARQGMEAAQLKLRDVSARAAADRTALEGQMHRQAEALSNAKNDTETASARLQALQDKHAAVQAQLSSLTVSHAQEQAAHVQACETLSQTRKSLLQAQADLSALQAKSADMTGKLVASAGELSSMTASLVAAQAAHGSAKEEVQRLQEELEAKAAMCRTLSHAHDKALDELADAERKVDMLSAQLAQEQIGHEQTREILGRTKKALLLAEEDGSSDQAKASELSSKLVAKINELSTASASLSALQSVHAATKDEMQRLQVELESKLALCRVLADGQQATMDSLAETQGKLASVTAQLEQEQAAHAHSKETLSAVRRSHAELETVYIAERDSRAALERQVTVLTSDLAARQAEVAATKDRLAGAEAQLQQSRVALDAVLQKYDSLDSAYSTSASEVHRFKEQLEPASEHTQRLAATVKTLEAELGDAKQKLADSFSQLASQAQQSREDRERLQAELVRLQYAAELLVAERTKLADALQTAKTAASASEARLEAQLQAERAAHADALTAAEDRARESLRLALAELDTLTKSRDRTVEHMNMLQAERDNFRDRSVALESEKGELMLRLGALSVEVEGLAINKEKQAEALRQRERECDELETGLNFTREALEEEIRARKEAVAVSHRAEMEVQSLQASIARAEAAVEEARRALHSEQDRTRELEAQCDELRVQLQSSMGGAASSSSTVEDLRQRLDEVRRRLAEYEQLSAAQAQTVATLREEAKQQIQEAQAAKAGMLKLQTRLNVAVSERDQSVAEVQAATTQAEGARARLAQAQMEASESTAEITRLKREVAQLKAVLQSSVSNKQLLQATVANIRAEVQQVAGRAGAQPGARVSGAGVAAVPGTASGGGAGSLVAGLHGLGVVSARGPSSSLTPVHAGLASEQVANTSTRADVSMSSTELASSFLYSPIGPAAVTVGDLRSPPHSNLKSPSGGTGRSKTLPTAQELRESLKPAAMR